MSPEHLPFDERKEFPYKVPLTLRNNFPPEELVLEIPQLDSHTFSRSFIFFKNISASEELY